MSFVQLPTELQIEILNYLQGPDLKSARSVCRKFRDNASPALFRCIVACTRYQAMGAFQKISLDPVYAKYVKEIVFDGSIFNEGLARNESMYIQAAEEFENLRHDFHWERRKRWRRYRELYEEQEDIRASGVLLQTISRGLEWMPNISSVVYSPGPHTIPIEAKTVRDLMPRVNNVGYGMQGGYPSNIYYGFHHLIGAIYFSQYTGIRAFHALRSSGEVGAEFRLSAFDFPEENSLDAGQYFFSKLHKIELDMSLISMHRSSGATPLDQLANFATLLSGATQLECLALHILHWKSSAERMYGHVLSSNQSMFRHLGLNNKWPRLRCLSLQGVYADEKELLGLITRQREILKTLKFERCSLHSGHWSEVVDEVVYNSKIIQFSLYLVNEVSVGDIDFQDLSPEDSILWQYQGQVRVREGERFYEEETVLNKKSVYAWRSYQKDEAQAGS